MIGQKDFHVQLSLLVEVSCIDVENEEILWVEEPHVHAQCSGGVGRTTDIYVMVALGAELAGSLTWMIQQGTHSSKRQAWAYMLLGYTDLISIPYLLMAGKV